MLLAGVGVAAVQQTTGSESFVFYTAKILEGVGVDLIVLPSLFSPLTPHCPVCL